jgi:hypothetical protein
MKFALNLGAVWRREVSFTSRPPYLRDRKRKPTDRPWVGPRVGLGDLVKRNFFTSAGIRTPGPSNPYPIRYTDCLPIGNFPLNSLPLVLRSVHEAGARERVTRERNIGVRGAGCKPSRQHLLLVNAVACQLGVFTLPRHGLSTLGHHFNKCTHLTVTFILPPK